MDNVRIAEGFYLLNKELSSRAPEIPTVIPTDYYVVIDCSGSMSQQLSQIRNHLKNKLPMLMKPLDTVSIVWFSGRNQYGVVLEQVALKTAVDLSGIHRAIDNMLKPIGLTGFVDPLREIKRLISRISAPGRASSLWFMSDGYENQHPESQVLEVVDGLRDYLSSAAIVEYGWYCNRPFMGKIAERLGAVSVFAEDFPQYEPSFETIFTKQIFGFKKVQVPVYMPLHSFAFTIDGDEVVSYSIENDTVSVPEGTKRVWWFAHLPNMDNFVDGNALHTDKNQNVALDALYGSLIPLSQRMLSNDVFGVLKVLGDTKLVRQFTNCFGKQAYTGFQDTVKELLTDNTKRYTEGYNPDSVPDEHAYTVLDLLHDLSSDEGNLFFPNHESFGYQRIGRKAIRASEVLNKDEVDRMAKFSIELTQTKNKERLAEIRSEISNLIDKRMEDLEFTPEDQEAGYPISNLVFNEDRPNVSSMVTIQGTVDLSVLNVPLPENVPVRFPTRIYRNYTVIRDGILNIKMLPVRLTTDTRKHLKSHGVKLHKLGDIELINLMELPIINRSMVKSVMAYELFMKQWELLNTKAAQKVYNYYYDEIFPPLSKANLIATYGSETADWLANLGIKDYGYSPKMVLSDSSDFYYGKELSVGFAGMTSLPSAKSVVEKIEAKKKLTPREVLLESPINGVRKNRVLDEVEFKTWVVEQKFNTTKRARELMREIAQIKFAIIVGQVWFTDLPGGLDDIEMSLTLDGKDVKGNVVLRTIEVKI